MSGMTLSYQSCMEMVFEACKLEWYWPSYRTLKFILGKKLVKIKQIVGQNWEFWSQVKNQETPSKIGRLGASYRTAAALLNDLFPLEVPVGKTSSNMMIFTELSWLVLWILSFAHLVITHKTTFKMHLHTLFFYF